MSTTNLLLQRYMPWLSAPRLFEAWIVRWVVGVLLLGAVAGQAMATTNWVQTNGPYGVDIVDLVIDPLTPATLYAATSGGAFKSTNGGGSWSAVNSGLANTNVQAIAIHPTTPATLYAGISGGAFKSTNGGGSWSAINSGLANTDVKAIAIDSTTPATLYAGTSGGVFKSTNGGGSWSAVNSGLSNTNVRAIAIHPSAPTTLYAGTWGGASLKAPMAAPIGAWLTLG